MDPLSITSGVIAILTASGKTIQGLERLWEIRHRDREFERLKNSIAGIRILLLSVELAFEEFNECSVGVEALKDCLGNITMLRAQVVDDFRALNQLFQDVKPRNIKSLVVAKPSVLKWMRYQSQLSHLLGRVESLAHSLAATLHMLQGLRNSRCTDVPPIKEDREFPGMNMLDDSLPRVHTTKSYHNSQMDSHSSSMESFHTTSDWNGASSSPMTLRDRFIESDSPLASEVTWTCLSTQPPQPQNPEVCGHISHRQSREHCDTVLPMFDACETFCQCLCHFSTQLRTPQWARHIIGSAIFDGNWSMLLNRRACDQSYCRRSGSLRIQISYIMPAWSVPRGCVVRTQAEAINGFAPSFNIFMPRTIAHTSIIWSLIELGNITKIKELFTLRLSSPYDVDLEGTSLLKYAASQGQDDVFAFLLAQRADPFLRDNSGIMAVQPGIDRVFTGVASQRSASSNGIASRDLFITKDSLEQQGFTDLHLVVLGYLCQDLVTILRYHRPNIDSTDANGRTPLLWAAWRGDIRTVDVLLNYGASINKFDHENYTPLARASQAGHLPTVRSLLKANASTFIATRWGYQPIHLACENKTDGHMVVEELLANSADPNAYSHGSGTPLHNAANCGSLETVMVLLSRGVDIDAIGENGDTAAMVALYCWNETAFLHLAKAGARLDIVNNSGHNIVQLATWSATVNTWKIITECAETGTLGFVDIQALHDGHHIEHCFAECRQLWFVGKIEDKTTERMYFDRMVRSCGKSKI